MSEQSESPATTPDPGALNFRLWLPRWDSSHRQLRCRFFAATTGLTQLDEGDAVCMAQLLADLGQTEARVTGWSVKRYRVTYFSDFPTAESWEDRLALTWAVEVRADSAVEPEDAGTHAPGPHGSHAHDTTFRDEDEAWDRTREHVLVIAGTPYGSRIDESLLALPQVVRSADGEVFDGMVALDLGELDLPDDLSKVDEVVARCEDLGLRTNWKD